MAGASRDLEVIRHPAELQRLGIVGQVFEDEERGRENDGHM